MTDTPAQSPQPAPRWHQAFPHGATVADLAGFAAAARAEGAPGDARPTVTLTPGGTIAELSCPLPAGPQ